MRLLLSLLLAVVCTAAPKVSTLVGNGTAGYSPTQINNPYGLVIGPDGALYVCEIGNHIVRRIDLKTGTMTVVAGTPGEVGYSGDGGPATKAKLNEPYEIRFDRQGNMYFVEMKNHLIRRVDRKTGVISTIAGTGEAGFSGDGGPATKAQFRQPHSIAFDRKGSMLVCDIGNHRIRRIDLKTSVISTFGGTGERKPTPDGAPLEGTPLNGPRAIDVAADGTLYLALREGNAIYRIDPKTRTIHHLGGTGEKGYSGDGGDARKAALSGPKGVAISPDGGLYLADTESHTVRRIDLKTGVITTVVGNGERGDGPEADPLQCKMNRPHGVYVDRKGVLYIGDSEAHRVRVWTK
jgi:DNA-binding beta-propeller fold protein YncE